MVSDRARIHVGVCEFTGYATPSVPEPTVFYPKKLTREVHNMLVGDWGAGGHTFVTWWKGSNQSRDFWVETPEEMVRIHVIPRKRTFDPGLWTTKYTHLRDNLLGCLGQARRTEAVPCVAEGLVMHASECLWRENDSELRIVSLFNLDCGSVAAASRSKLLLVGLFRALQLERCMSAPALKSPLKAELQAELEAYSVVVHHKWTVPELRSLVIEQRQARGSVKHQQGGPHGRHHQDDFGAAEDRGHEAGLDPARAAHPRTADEDAARRPADRGHHGAALRQVQGVALCRDTTGVYRDWAILEIREQPSRPGPLRELGRGEREEAGDDASRRRRRPTRTRLGDGASGQRKGKPSVRNKTPTSGGRGPADEPRPAQRRQGPDGDVGGTVGSAQTEARVPKGPREP